MWKLEIEIKLAMSTYPFNCWRRRQRRRVPASVPAPALALSPTLALAPAPALVLAPAPISRWTKSCNQIETKIKQNWNKNIRKSKWNWHRCCCSWSCCFCCCLSWNYRKNGSKTRSSSRSSSSRSSSICVNFILILLYFCFNWFYFCLYFGKLGFARECKSRRLFSRDPKLNQNQAWRTSKFFQKSNSKR